jgi:CRISPR-associated protein Cas2
MLIVSYDISSTPKRTRFSKFLEKFGIRFQFSMFRIKNSQRVLEKIKDEVEHKFQQDFTQEDSVVIMPICEACEKKIIRYGHAKNEEEDIIII